MTAEPRCWGGGGVSHPSQLTTGLVIKSVTTSPTLAGERMLFILQVSILSEQVRKAPAEMLLWWCQKLELLVVGGWRRASQWKGESKGG